MDLLVYWNYYLLSACLSILNVKIMAFNDGYKSSISSLEMFHLFKGGVDCDLIFFILNSV